MRPRLVALAVFIVGLAMANSAVTTGVRVFSLLICAIALLIGAKIKADRLAQAGLSTFAMVAGVLAARLVPTAAEVPESLSQRSLLLGLPMLAVAAARSCIDKPVYGHRLTLVAALVALTAAGRAQAGFVYPALAALAVVTGFFAAWANDPRRGAVSQLQWPHYAGILFGLAMAATTAFVAVRTLPRLHETMVTEIMSRMARNRAGISNSITLGSMDGMDRSDAVVMRVRGPRPELLRGVILVDYRAGRWERDRIAMTQLEVVETETTPVQGASEIEHAKTVLRYFLPLGAQNVATSTGFFNREGDGLLRPSDEAFAKRIWFTPGDPPTTPAPQPSELQVPARIGPDLSKRLALWGVTGLPPREAADRIFEQLRSGYEYSLTFERSGRIDPTIEFLEHDKRGHCEYFASAFALLARAAHIPARVINGYHLMETSPFGYAIVRERHAHSWVEVWIDGHWESYDPTPTSDLPGTDQSVTPWLQALLDGMRTGWEVADDWLSRRTAFELSLLLVALVGALVIVRALRGRKRAARVVEEAPQELQALTRALERKGLARTAHETVGAYAKRVQTAEQLGRDVRDEIVGLLARYEAYRYGGSAEDAVVLGEMKRAATLLR